MSRKYGTFFSIETSQNVVKYDTWRKFLDTKIDGQRIYKLLDKYNGVYSFGEKEQIDIVNTIEKVRRMPEFAKICPGFAVTNKEDASKPAKDFLDKDHKRMEDLKIRGNNDIIKMTKLAYNMAKAITDNDKYERRLQAAIDVYGKDSPIAKVFKSRSLDLFDNMRAFSESIEDIDVNFIDDSANDLIDKGIHSVEFTIGGKEYEIEVKNDVEGVVVFYDKENTQAFEFEDVMMKLPLLLAIRKFTKSRIYGKDIENVRVETWFYLR